MGAADLPGVTVPVIGFATGGWLAAAGAGTGALVATGVLDDALAAGALLWAGAFTCGAGFTGLGVATLGAATAAGFGAAVCFTGTGLWITGLRCRSLFLRCGLA